MAAVKSFKAYVSSVSPSSERMEEFWVVCVYMRKIELRCWWEDDDENKLVERKAFLDTVETKSSYLKGKFLFKSSCKERTQTAMCFLEL